MLAVLLEAIGDASRIEEVRGNGVKGNLVLSRRWYLAERAPPSAANNVMRALGEEPRRLLEHPIMPFSWVPFGPLIDIDLAIIEEVMRGQIERMRGFGYDLGRRDVGGVYRAFFLSLASTEFLLEKLTAIGSMYFRDSTLGFVRGQEPGQGRVLLVGRSMPLYMCRYGITGWLEALMQTSRAFHIHVEHATCVHAGDSQCSWECRWHAPSSRSRRGSP